MAMLSHTIGEIIWSNSDVSANTPAIRKTATIPPFIFLFEPLFNRCSSLDMIFQTIQSDGVTAPGLQMLSQVGCLLIMVEVL